MRKQLRRYLCNFDRIKIHGRVCNTAREKKGLRTPCDKHVDESYIAKKHVERLGIGKFYSTLTALSIFSEKIKFENAGVANDTYRCDTLLFQRASLGIAVLIAVLQFCIPV